MKKLNRMLAIATAAIALFACANPLLAQQGGPGGGGQGGGRGNRQGGPGGGNFDPAQMQQRMMERLKEQLEITDDNDWKAIEPLVQKVNDARMAAGSGMGRGMMGMGRNRGGNNGDNADQGNQRRGGFGQPNPDAEALQKAIDAKASGAELKTALQKYTESRKAKQATLEKAQAELRKVLTPRQEAIATLNGLL